jgi:hypothetical protein
MTSRAASPLPGTAFSTDGSRPEHSARPTFHGMKRIAGPFRYNPDSGNVHANYPRILVLGIPTNMGLEKIATSWHSLCAVRC